MKLLSSRLLSQDICNILVRTDRSQKNDFALAHSCKNLTLTVTCLIVSCVKSLLFATTNVAVLFAHTITVNVRWLNLVRPVCIAIQTEQLLNASPSQQPYLLQLSLPQLCKVQSSSDDQSTMKLLLRSSELYFLKLT